MAPASVARPQQEAEGVLRILPCMSEGIYPELSVVRFDV